VKFRLAMHPASEGDALQLTWGQPRRYAFIDLGRTGDYRKLRPLLGQIGKFELFVVSHVDADHIEGAMPLFRETTLPFSARHVWFNGREQLDRAANRTRANDREPLGPGQGEKMTTGILRSGWPWNVPFESGVVSVDSAEATGPIELDGGLTIILLSPSDAQLSDLLPVWDRELEKSHLRTADPDEVQRALIEGREHFGSPDVVQLAAKPFKIDKTEANGSSIAFIAEFNGRRVLCGADAHPDVLERSLRRHGASERTPMLLHCFKVSHHGSKANTSPSLLSIINCTRFAFSTDGSRHGHPDAETIARILIADPDRQKTLIFNFRQPSTLRWDSAELKERYNYECVFPSGDDGIEFDV